MKRLPLLADFILFIVLCASLAYWGMPFYRPQPSPVALPALPSAPPMPLIEAAAGLFGGAATGARSFLLQGVIAAGAEGVAILSADGKPAHAVRVGTEAEPGVMVQEVAATYVLLNDGGAIKRVDLPANPKGALAVAAPAPPVMSAIPGQPATVMQAKNEQKPSQQAPVTHIDPVPVASPPTAVINANNGQMYPQPSSRRPSGIGPAAWGAKPATGGGQG